MYYPEVHFLIRHIMISPAKFISNDILANALDFKSRKQQLYGYVSFTYNDSNGDLRLLMLDKDEPNLSRSQNVIGMWLAGQKIDSKGEREKVFWALIMEYFRNPQVKNRLSINMPRTGIIITMEPPKKVTHYLFEIPQDNNSKWSFNIQTDYHPRDKFPLEFSFTNQEVIFEEEKE